jgi:long-chain acyl-CoA synthetase
VEKVWLKRYPPGVPHEVRYDEFESVRDLFEASVKKYGDRPAYHNMGKSITFADLDRMSRAFGAGCRRCSPRLSGGCAGRCRS